MMKCNTLGVGFMNNEKLKMLRAVSKAENHTQRGIADVCNMSLGKTNKLINYLINDGYIEAKEHNYILAEKAVNLLEQYRVDNAIIMAAGFGSRFIPLTYETPKGLLEVFGERMIERQIKQLLDVLDCMG